MIAITWDLVLSVFLGAVIVATMGWVFLMTERYPVSDDEFCNTMVVYAIIGGVIGGIVYGVMK